MSMDKRIEQKELGELLRSGDKSVMKMLYIHYSESIYGVILRIVQNEEQAKDILQDVFVQIWKKGKSFDPSKGSLFTWILNIARNKSIDRLRSNNRSPEIQNDVSSVYIENSSSNLSPKEDTIGLKDLVGQLDEELKTVIDLAYFGGRTQSEMAEELDIPLGTVKTRIRKGLQILRKQFK